MGNGRDHGGGLDAAIARWGGERAGWLDLSTGINPVAYTIPPLTQDDWTALPDAAAFALLERAARRFWNVPEGVGVLAAAGASALIARLPALRPATTVAIAAPTYNEHAAAFDASGWRIANGTAGEGAAQVAVHPNNPDGRIWRAEEITASFAVIDESFCDVTPEDSLIALAADEGRVVLKSFGKFWGLAGLRLGFAIGREETLAPLREMLGPWQVSGPALRIGAMALEDTAWAEATRARLSEDAARLDALLAEKGAQVVGGTDLFRLYDVGDAARWQARLAEGHVWSRIFPYSERWLRLGLPHLDGWDQLEAAL
ncbi:threonine-phosphate decarboxylase [Pelagovum sp. HNIBRBA483]|uniref:threonine-phosphate decarboxylase n=1 Tax=Pelagovum sp. HNIBRBA483 TaxID=3233341 RepID=UPI0034A2D984